MRSLAFASSRTYFSLGLLLLAMWATSFVAAYLLPAAIVAFAACLLFAGVGILWPKHLKATSQNKENRPPTKDTPMGSMEQRLGVSPAERN